MNILMDTLDCGGSRRHCDNTVSTVSTGSSEGEQGCLGALGALSSVQVWSVGR